MNVIEHPSAGSLLTFQHVDEQHVPILQRMARRIAGNNWVTTFKLETCNLLRRMGYDVPDVFDNYQMRGKFKPYKHQIITSKFLFNLYRGWCLNGLRSGKTSSVGWAADCLMKHGEIKSLLVLAPLSILETSWARELFYINPTLHIYVANRSIKHMRAYCEKHGNPDVIIMNHDKLRFIKNWMHQVYDPDLVVVDEATGFKDCETDRYKSLELLMSVKRRLWLLTGTPAPNSPLDVYGLSRFVNPNTPATIGDWRTETMVQTKPGVMVPRRGHEKIVAELLKPAIRFATADCIDMPKQTYHDMKINLTPDQSTAYKDMVNNMKMDAEHSTIVAENAAIKVFKLLQICAGVVLDNNGKPHIIGAAPRIAECSRLVSQAAGKVIICCPFTQPQNYIAQELGKHFKVAIVNGQVTGRARTKVFDEFQTGDTEVLIAHPAVIQFGLALTAASITIWWTPTFSTLHYIQANERQRGPGTSMTGVYHLMGTPLERRIITQIQSNSVTNESIVDFYRVATEGSNPTVIGDLSREAA